MSILRLPVIILLRVFFYLDVSSLRKTAEVCQTFFKCTEMIAAANLDLSSEWRTLETVPVSSVTSFAFRVFEKLSLRYCVKVTSFEFLAKFNKLTLVDLYGANVRDCHLDALSTSLQLVAIDLGYCRKLTSTGLRDFLRTQASLRGIGLASCGVNGDAVKDEVLGNNIKQLINNK